MDKWINGQNGKFKVCSRYRMSCQKCKYLDANLRDYTSICDVHGTFNRKPIKPKHHEGNGRHNGAFAGTLTMSPEWNENEETMVTAIKKILYQDTCPVKRFRWNLEFCKDGKPHIHFIYETVTGGRIHRRIFKRYWNHWSEKKEDMDEGKRFKGGYHRVCYAEEAYQKYIAKDNGRCGRMDE